MSLAGPFPNLGRDGATSFAVFRLGDHLQEFASGHREFALHDAHALGITLDEQYTLQGIGTLRVGTTQRVDPSSGATEVLCHGAWQGNDSSIRATVVNAKPREMVALFDQFSIRETSDGPTLEPRSGSVVVEREPALAPSVIHEFTGELGVVDVKARTDAIEELLAVAYDVDVEIFRDSERELFTALADPDSPRASLMTETAVVTILPDREASEHDTTDAALNLDAVWST